MMVEVWTVCVFILSSENVATRKAGVLLNLLIFLDLIRFYCSCQYTETLERIIGGSFLLQTMFHRAAETQQTLQKSR